VNNRIYVIYVVPDSINMSTVNRIMFFNSNNPSTMTNSTIEFEKGLIEYKITPKGTICLGLKEAESVCPLEARVYFYDYNLLPKNQISFSAAHGCVREFTYVKELNYFVFISYCNGKIYFFEDSENNIEIRDSCAITGPHTFEYNSNDSLGYCFGQATSSTSCLYSINIGDSTGTPLTIPHPLEMIKESFYNPNDHFVYGISSDTIYKIGNEALQGKYSLEKTVDLNNDSNREDDYIFNTADNLLYLVITDDEGYINSKKILEVNLNDGVNKLISSDLSYQKSVKVNYPTKPFSGLGKQLSYFGEKQNIFCAQMYFSNASFITTHSENSSFRGDWNWLSYPCMPRLGNANYSSRSLLENINPYRKNLHFKHEMVDK